MGLIRIIAGFVMTVTAAATVIGLFIGFSAVVLWVTGRMLPLAGRGRRKD